MPIFTSLHQAAQNGHAKTVKRLLIEGANPNCMGNNGITPLFIAAQEGYTEIVKMLLENGADPNLENGIHGITALAIAAKKKHLPTIKQLLTQINPKLAKITDKETLLSLATQMSTTHLDQSDIINNYNILASELKHVGIDLSILDKTGMCLGLSSYYFKCAKRKQHSEYIACLKFLSLLNDKQKIVELVQQYKIKGKRLLVAPAPGETPIPFEVLFSFMQGIALAQKQQTLATTGTGWDNTKTYFCYGKDELINCLTQAGIEKRTYMTVALGLHRFAIERVHGDPGGFYVIEPNNLHLEPHSTMPKFFRTIEEVAQEFYYNYSLLDDFPEPDKNYHIAFSILFLSDDDINDENELDKAINTWEQTKSKSDAYPTLERFITHYRQGQQSRVDLALVLCDEIKKFKIPGNAIPEALEILLNSLKNYLNQYPIAQDQNYIDILINEHLDYVTHTATCSKISWLYLATYFNQIELVKKLLAKGANPDHAIQNGYTPLTIAVMEGHVEMVKILLENGVDLNNPIYKKCTPLSVAVIKEHKEIVNILSCVTAFNRSVQLFKSQNSTTFFLPSRFDNNFKIAYHHHPEYFQQQLSILLNGNTLTANQLTGLCSTEFILTYSALFNPELINRINKFSIQHQPNLSSIELTAANFGFK